MGSPRRLAVAATAPFGADVLERLAARHELAFLLTRPDRPRGRGRRPGPPPAKVTAERLGIPVLQPERLDGFEPAETMVVAAYGVLIPTPLLERALWLNVHPSLLPRWRGAAPVERAILAGDEETGVTIHETTPELDAGAVSARAAELAVELLDEVLPEPSFVPQPEKGATYAEKLTPADRELDWSAPPGEISRRVRALSPHIGAQAELDGREVIVWRVDGEGRPLEVQPAGRRRMSYEEFRRGLR